MGFQDVALALFPGGTGDSCFGGQGCFHGDGGPQLARAMW